MDEVVVNDINKMPPKCQYCPYWEVCKYPWVCPDIGDKKPKRTEERTETHACDLISRAMLLDYIHNEPIGKMLCDRYNLDGVIKQLPSAQPYTDEEIQKMQDIEQAQLDKAYEMGKADALRWIPCSERLPKEDTEVLISYRYKEGEGDTDHVNIDITSYGTTCFGGREIHTLKEWRQPFDYFHANYEVIAWMPLPTPYREE